MTATERLTEIKARAEAATEGPWAHESTEFREHLGHSVKSSVGSVVLFGGYGPRGGTSEANALLAAHARTDVPALVKALEAVLEEHKPDWSDWGLDHPDEGASCSCGHNGAYEECPTVEAINEALGGDQP